MYVCMYIYISFSSPWDFWRMRTIQMLSLLGLVNSLLMFLALHLDCLVNTVLFFLMPVYMGHISYNSKLASKGD